MSGLKSCKCWSKVHWLKNMRKENGSIPVDDNGRKIPGVRMAHVHEVAEGGSAPLEGWNLVPCRTINSHHFMTLGKFITCDLSKEKMFWIHLEPGLHCSNVLLERYPPSYQCHHVVVDAWLQMGMFHWQDSDQIEQRLHSLHFALDHNFHSVKEDHEENHCTWNIKRTEGYSVKAATMILLYHISLGSPSYLISLTIDFRSCTRVWFLRNICARGVFE